MVSDEALKLTLKQIYEQHGYKKYRMSKFEEYSFYMENKKFLTSDRFITFTDRDGRLMALKPDITMSIAKNTRATYDKPERVYYSEGIFRMDKDGEYKELFQIGTEIMGRVGSLETLEIIYLALKSLETLEENNVLAVSHMGYILSLLEAIGSPEGEVLKGVFHCLKHKNKHDLDLLGECGALSSESIELIRNVIDINGDIASASQRALELSVNDGMANAARELQEIAKAFSNTKYNKNLCIDFSVISNTQYYNSLIFSGYISSVTTSVLVGGRYDNLLKKMGHASLEAIGFAVNFSEVDKKLFGIETLETDEIIAVEDDMSDLAAFELMRELSENSIRVKIVRGTDVEGARFIARNGAVIGK